MAQKDNKHKKEKLSQEELIQNSSLFIDAIREKQLGNSGKAMGLFAQCITQNPKNDAALYEMAFLMIADRRYEEALTLCKKAVSLNPENNWYLLLLARIYSKISEYSNAGKIYKILTEKNPEQSEYFLEWADIYIGNGNYQEAIKIYDSYEKKSGIEPEIILQKHKLYTLMGKNSKAIEEIQKLIKEFPDVTEYQAMLADVYLSNNMAEEAYDLYQQILLKEPNDPYVHLSLADYYRMQNNTEKVIEELKLAISNTYLNIDDKIKVLLQLMDVSARQKAYKDALPELGALLVESAPNEAKAFSIYGDILSDKKQYFEARNAYRKVNTLDSSKYVIWKQIILIDSELNDSMALAADSKKAIELFPEQAEPYYFNGIAEMQLKNYNKAIKSLNTGKNFISNDNNLLLKFYTALGDCYYKIKNYEKCFDFYEKALEIDPNYYYVLNNYSYYLALQGINLERALQLSEKLVSKKGDIYYYLDTHAWVLYKMKDYQKAKTWIEKAVSSGGINDADVLDHYGDILYKNNEPEKALEYWLKAKNAGMSSEILDKKIREKKLYE